METEAVPVTPCPLNVAVARTWEEVLTVIPAGAVNNPSGVIWPGPATVHVTAAAGSQLGIAVNCCTVFSRIGAIPGVTKTDWIGIHSIALIRGFGSEPEPA